VILPLVQVVGICCSLCYFSYERLFDNCFFQCSQEEERQDPMPNFTNATVSVLKRTILPRAPEYIFTPEDVELVVAETGLRTQQVIHWADTLRWKIKNHLLGDIEEFFKACSDSQDKVNFSCFSCIQTELHRLGSHEIVKIDLFIFSHDIQTKSERLESDGMTK